MSITKEYLTSLAVKGYRVDGRAFDAYRPVTIEYGVSQKSAEGSARVKIGETEVVAGVKLDIGTPFPDKPDEGSIVVNVELLPLSSPMFEAGPPSVNAIELSRVTDRGIRESETLDFKKLCITSGEKVWMVYIDIYPLNSAGNLFDACALAALAALRDACFPKIEGGKVDYEQRTKTKLPIAKLPTGCTVWKLGNAFIVDPTLEEENEADARLTVVFSDDKTICAMQKGGNVPLSIEEMETMINIAQNKTQELRRLFK